MLGLATLADPAILDKLGGAPRQLGAAGICDSCWFQTLIRFDLESRGEYRDRGQWNRMFFWSRPTGEDCMIGDAP